MKVTPTSSFPNAAGRSMSPVVLKKTGPKIPEMNLPSAKMQHGTGPVKNSEKENPLNQMMHKEEMERLLKMASHYQEKESPHFTVEKGRMMDIFA